MNRKRDCSQTAEIALVTASIHGSIAVQDLLPETCERDPNAVVVPWHGREVADEKRRIFRAFSAPNKADNASLIVCAVHPLETSSIAIPLV
jgi:hypothetical protein